MSFWVGPRSSRRSTVNRPPPPGRNAPGVGMGDAPQVKTFPKQKNSNSAEKLTNDQLDGQGLFPSARRERKGTVQGAPPAPDMQAPSAPPPRRRGFSWFSNTAPANVEKRQSNAPPPITEDMKTEVRRKSRAASTIVNDDLEKETEVEEPTMKKKKSNVFRTTTDTEWTDEDLNGLHGEMKQEFERLTSLSSQRDGSSATRRNLNQTASMSLSRNDNSPGSTGEWEEPQKATSQEGGDGFDDLQLESNKIDHEEVVGDSDLPGLWKQASVPIETTTLSI